MSVSPSCFIQFKHSITGVELPNRFTFPFFYTPHPLAIKASKELQAMLNTDNSVLTHGKMFGVLVVKNIKNEIGYLAAYSGKSKTLVKNNCFVPAISDQYEINPVFITEQQSINQLTRQLNELTHNPLITSYKKELQSLHQSFKNALTKQQELMAEGRKQRKQQRTNALLLMNEQDTSALLADLAKESVRDKNALKTLKLLWHEKISITQRKLYELEQAVTAIQKERQSRSSSLQNLLFEQYQIKNSEGNTKPLQEVFEPTPQHTPPAGSGDCAAPKLLQYAFNHNLKPLTLAEFWWGESPKSEVRQHKNYYPACIGKCEPILNWMLTGLEIDENPLLKNPAEGKNIEIIYQDDAIAIINKPHNFLSVPGRHIQDSVQTRMKTQFPDATGSLIVHRLDMPTSGLMVIALTKRAHKALQKQFIHREINKRYVALLDGKINEKTGLINLPLRGDLHDRPRQIVCAEHGKVAETTWEVIEHINNKTKIYLSPKTGRTHQLRVHCAHLLGLNTPIVGDDLYGKSDERLYLHAEKLELNHPITKQRMIFQVEPKF